MSKEELLVQAQVIADKMNDLDALWFYYKAVKILGFQTCYELASYALDMSRQGKLETSPARYFNGCVMKEVRNRGLEWNTKNYA